MYTHDLNSAYSYEHERRTDEMRAAGQSELLTPGLKSKHKGLFKLIVVVLLIIVWIVI